MDSILNFVGKRIDEKNVIFNNDGSVYAIDDGADINWETVRDMMTYYSKEVQSEQIEKCALYAAAYFAVKNGASYSLCDDIYQHVKQTIKVIL